MFKIKTLIELFDECQIENIIAALRVLPEKIIFVGYAKIMNEDRIENLKDFFESKKMPIELQFVHIKKFDYDDVCDKLNYILDNNNDCCFDLTGGKELVLTAMGEISAIRKIPMIQFDVKSGKMMRIRNAEDISDSGKAGVSIEETINLNNGVIVENGLFENWNLTDDFKSDIKMMWDICRSDTKKWNKLSSSLSFYDKNSLSDNKQYIYVDFANVKKQELDEEMFGKLTENKLITEYKETDNSIAYKYKNEQVRRCINKAGNMLELVTYMVAHKITEKYPGFYDDVDVGVFIDWDGKIERGWPQKADTRNEIDIMLMKDMIPVFISCKSGEVDKEALYELSTVASRFGGKYAKKFMFTTYIQEKPTAREFITKRAQDMNIVIIENIDGYDTDGLMSVMMDNVK